MQRISRRFLSDVGFFTNGPAGAALGIAKQSPKTFLLKMPVFGENLCQAFLAHRLHRDAIDQAVAFVGAGAVSSNPATNESWLCGMTRTVGSCSMASTLDATSRRKRSGDAQKNVRYSARTSSVVTMSSAICSARAYAASPGRLSAIQ